MPSTNVFNELCVKISLLRPIKTKKIITVRNAVYFRLCINLVHILPPVTAEELDGSHHPNDHEKVVPLCKNGRKGWRVKIRISKSFRTGNSHGDLRQYWRKTAVTILCEVLSSFLVKPRSFFQ